MRKITQTILVFTFTLLVFSNHIFSQAKTGAPERPEGPYDEMNIKFVLDADPAPQDVGFDDPKSYWRFKYELRFLQNQKAALNKLGYQYFQEVSGETPAERTSRIEINNKRYEKAWKKFGIRVAKGKISKTSLLLTESRDIEILVPLSPEIKNILAQANSTNSFPDFRIRITGKIYSKTSSNSKFKQKISSSYVCGTRTIVNGASAWMMNTCGVYIGVSNKNNKIYLSSSSRL